MALKLTIKPRVETTWATLPAPELKVVEPCGASAEHAVAVSVASNLVKDEEKKKANEAKAAAALAAGQPGSPSSPTTRGGTGKTVKLSDEDLETDWYDVLKLASSDATDDEIIAAHRKRCLETHPDKQKDKSDTLFKQVQRALEILTNPDARRAYDSSKLFDDSIPNPTAEFAGDEEFLEAFAPVFKRNAKWSTKAYPANLSLGKAYGAEEPIDAKDIKEIRKFYDFWLAFRSWRDFAHECELENIDENMDRYNKRHIQKENQRKVDALKRDETKRIRSLVDRAMKFDTRLKRFTQREKEAAAAAKKKKEEERTAHLREQVRKEEEAKAKAKAEKEAKEAAEESGKDAIKVNKVKLENFLKEKGLTEDIATNMFFLDKIRMPNIKWYTQKAKPEEVAECVEAVLAESCERCISTEDKEFIPAVVTFNEYVEKTERRVRRDRMGQPCPATKPLTPKPVKKE